MEMIIVYLSVPLFLLGVLVIALFVLPRYPGGAPAYATPTAVNTPGTYGSPPDGSAPGTNSGPTNIVGWGLTIVLFAPFVVAMISELKLHKEN
jgi:hypothetical protein